ncbi:MAG: hypothetical protein sGL2_06330 [Candidatus Mesenet longicola]|nr:MAG: hypothetical protein sGL2_06330 [Candidatus Mesenet longicola]
MLYINSQAIDKTTDINQIIEAIKALNSVILMAVKS